jgi:hypothetical protein
MSDDRHVRVYDADNSVQAELIREELESHEIQAYIDDYAGPLDGLTAAGGGTPLFVPAAQAEKARQIIDRFVTEHEAFGEDADEDADERPDE